MADMSGQRSILTQIFEQELGNPLKLLDKSTRTYILDDIVTEEMKECVVLGFDRKAEHLISYKPPINPQTPDDLVFSIQLWRLPVTDGEKCTLVLDEVIFESEERDIFQEDVWERHTEIFDDAPDLRMRIHVVESLDGQFLFVHGKYVLEDIDNSDDCIHCISVVSTTTTKEREVIHLGFNAQYAGSHLPPGFPNFCTLTLPAQEDNAKFVCTPVCFALISDATLMQFFMGVEDSSPGFSPEDNNTDSNGQLSERENAAAEAASESMLEMVQSTGRFSHAQAMAYNMSRYGTTLDVVEDEEQIENIVESGEAAHLDIEAVRNILARGFKELLMLSRNRPPAVIGINITHLVDIEKICAKIIHENGPEYRLRDYGAEVADIGYHDGVLGTFMVAFLEVELYGGHPRKDWQMWEVLIHAPLNLGCECEQECEADDAFPKHVVISLERVQSPPEIPGFMNGIMSSRLETCLKEERSRMAPPNPEISLYAMNNLNVIDPYAGTLSVLTHPFLSIKLQMHSSPASNS